MHSQILRTPESAFSHLVDYPFTPNYIEVDGMRMHYVDEGIGNKKTVFLLHGQPSWSYLYRHMIPLLVNEGYRVIAPDLIGFGKSDKPSSSDVQTYANQVRWMNEFIQKLGVKNAAAFMQDWGGMIGLRVLAQQPKWLDRLVLANTALAEMSGFEKFMVPKVLKLMASFSGKPSIETLSNKMNYGNWAGYFKHAETLEIGKVIQALTTRHLSQDEMSAYDAPFPDSRFYAAPRKMPAIVASDLNEVNEAWQHLKQWDKPVLTLFSNEDPFLADQGYDIKFQHNFQGARHQPHTTIEDASHFLQEDKSTQLANQMIAWLDQTRFK